MKDSKKELTEWLGKQAEWIQVTAKKILEDNTLSDDIIDSAYKMLKEDAMRKIPKSSTFSFDSSSMKSGESVKLSSLGEIQGIDALAPRRALEFADDLTVIYGLNGAGKSGYTRILKKASGRYGAKDLVSNVYKPEAVEKSCVFKIKNQDGDNEVKWSANSTPISLLTSLDIYDSNVGEFYLEGERGVSYLPQELLLIENIVKVFGQLKGKLEKERANLKTKLPTVRAIDCKYKKEMYENLRPNTDIKKLSEFYTYSEQDKNLLKKMEEKIQKAPLELQKLKMKRKNAIQLLLREVFDAQASVSKEAAEIIYNNYIDFQNKKSASIEGAGLIKSKSSLEGVGEDTWKAMWMAAKKYSINDSYPNEGYPYLEESSVCVFCQQELSPDAKDRLQKFEDFVVSNLEQDLNKSKTIYLNSLENFKSIPSDEDIKMKILAAQLDEEKWLPVFKEKWKSISSSISAIREKTDETFEGLAEFKNDFEELQKICESLESESLEHGKDAEDFDKESLEKNILELKGKNWCSGYLEAMKDEIKRLSAIEEIDTLLKSLDTRGVSKKAGELSKNLITEAYVQRFNNELQNLGARGIRVELVKTRVTQGQVKHKVQLHGLNTDFKKSKVTDVLSEGERRIVSLASFLADVTGREDNSPFIFDDPITSMDQVYEENTVERLVRLSGERQVIVFTHRLSMLGLFNETGSPLTKYIRRESWGTGEHSDLPLKARKPINAINKLKNEDLAQARKALENDGADAYSILAKSICSNFRILLERIIEIDFFADVVRRHRRQIKTDGVLKKLSRITEDDCAIIEKFMSKYSTYEHSQSDEAPSSVILPDELNTDFEEFIGWHTEFLGRNI